MKQDNNILIALVYPNTPLGKIVEQKGVIEEMKAQFEEMEQDTTKITEVTTQFWGSIVQDKQLEKLTKHLQ